MGQTAAIHLRNLRMDSLFSWLLQPVSNAMFLGGISILYFAQSDYFQRLVRGLSVIDAKVDRTAGEVERLSSR
jgi:hypothetical protein